MPNETTQELIAARGSKYGEFTDNAAISQRLKAAIHYDEAHWANLKPFQREALEMIAVKISRILNGDPNYVDNWHDIAGYATLVENILLTGQSHPGA